MQHKIITFSDPKTPLDEKFFLNLTTQHVLDCVKITNEFSSAEQRWSMPRFLHPESGSVAIISDVDILEKNSVS